VALSRHLEDLHRRTEVVTQLQLSGDLEVSTDGFRARLRDGDRGPELVVDATGRGALGRRQARTAAEALANVNARIRVVDHAGRELALLGADVRSVLGHLLFRTRAVRPRLRLAAWELMSGRRPQTID
jgi:hypothetical protein